MCEVGPHASMVFLLHWPFIRTAYSTGILLCEADATAS